MDDLNVAEDDDSSLAAVLGDAWDAAVSSDDSADASATPEPAHTDGETQSGPSRDDKGRFASSAATETTPADPEPPSTAPAETIDAPDGWTAAQKIEWDKLPTEAKRVIADREMSFKQVQEKLNRFSPVEERLERHRPQLAIAGTSEAQFINNLIAAHEALISNPRVALQTIARQYGVDPQTVFQLQQQVQQQTAPDPISALNQRIAQLEAAGHTQQQAAMAAQQEQVLAQINDFASAREGEALKHPHFNDVRGMMGTLIDGGQAKTLEQAYEMACRAHPDVSRRVAEAARLAEQRQAQRIADEAKRKAVSISGSPPQPGSSAASEADLRTMLMAAWDETR
jgi:hypothetical protein